MIETAGHIRGEDCGGQRVQTTVHTEAMEHGSYTTQEQPVPTVASCKLVLHV